MLSVALKNPAAGALIRGLKGVGCFDNPFIQRVLFSPKHLAK
jgi:hypothetical protein